MASLVTMKVCHRKKEELSIINIYNLYSYVIIPIIMQKNV